MLVTKQRVQLTLGFVWVLVRFFFFFLEEDGSGRREVTI